MTTSYYNRIVAAAEDYLGPAAERFIIRQIEFHISKKPETINRKDVLKLGQSVGVSLSLLIKDKTVINDAVRKFNLIAKE